MFAYYYLTLFHLYVAIGTATLTLMTGGRSFSAGWLALCALTAVLMALPLVGQAISMGAFLSKDIVRFETISETESLLSAIRRAPRAFLVDYYTVLVVLTPITYVALLRMVARERQGRKIFLAVMGLFCLSLFFTQLSLQYFGLCLLVLGPLLIAKWWADRVAAGQSGCWRGCSRFMALPTRCR